MLICEEETYMDKKVHKHSQGGQKLQTKFLLKKLYIFVQFSVPRYAIHAQKSISEVSNRNLHNKIVFFSFLLCSGQKIPQTQSEG